jgi:hypothetical protein
MLATHAALSFVIFFSTPLASFVLYDLLTTLRDGGVALRATLLRTT